MGGLWYHWKCDTYVCAREEKLIVPEFISGPCVMHLKKMYLPFQYGIKMMSHQMAKGKVEMKKKKSLWLAQQSSSALKAASNKCLAPQRYNKNQNLPNNFSSHFISFLLWIFLWLGKHMWYSGSSVWFVCATSILIWKRKKLSCIDRT